MAGRGQARSLLTFSAAAGPRRRKRWPCVLVRRGSTVLLFRWTTHSPPGVLDPNHLPFILRRQQPQLHPPPAIVRPWFSPSSIRLRTAQHPSPPITNYHPLYTMFPDARRPVRGGGSRSTIRHDSEYPVQVLPRGSPHVNPVARSALTLPASSSSADLPEWRIGAVDISVAGASSEGSTAASLPPEIALFYALLKLKPGESSNDSSSPPPPLGPTTAVAAPFNGATSRGNSVRRVRDGGVDDYHVQQGGDSIVDDRDWMRDDEPESDDTADSESDMDIDGSATSRSTSSGDEREKEESVGIRTPAAGDYADLLTCRFGFTGPASLSGWEGGSDGAAEDTCVKMANADDDALAAEDTSVEMASAAEVVPTEDDNVEMTAAEKVAPPAGVVAVGFRLWLRWVRKDVGSSGSSATANGLPRAPASSQELPDAHASTAGISSTSWPVAAVEDAQDVESAPAEK